MRNVVISLVTVGALAFSATGMAYGGGDCGRGGQRFHGMMSHMLDLTEDQQTQIDAIRTQYKPARGAMRAAKPMLDLDPTDPNYEAQLSLAAEEAAEAAKQQVLNMAAMRAEIQAVLTPEQLEKMATIKADMSDRAARRFW